MKYRAAVSLLSLGACSSGLATSSCVPAEPATEEQRAMIRTGVTVGAIGTTFGGIIAFMSGRVRHDIYNLLEDFRQYELTKSPELRKKILSPKFQRYIKCRQRRLRTVQMSDVLAYGVVSGFTIAATSLPVALVTLAPYTALMAIRGGEDRNAYRILQSYRAKQFNRKSPKPVLRCTRGIAAASTGYSYLSAALAAQRAILMFDFARFV